MRVIVLGGAGDMGSRAVRDLVEQPDVEALVIGDYDEARARALAGSLHSPRVSVVKVDANDHDALVRAITPYDVVASAVGPFYKFEAKCAAAAIDAGRAYVSICDDYDGAQAALALDETAQQHGVTVLTGMGWTPGLSNILARKGVEELQSVDEINVAWSGSAADSKGFAVILHTLHIFTGVVPSFQTGRLVDVPAGSGEERVRFPQPVGEISVFHLGHPETVTLPRTFPSVRTVTLKGGLSEGLLNSLSILMNTLHLTRTPKRREIVARFVKPLLPVLSRVGKPAHPCSAIRVDVKGTKNGRRAQVTYGAADHMDALTAVPLAIGALMLGRGAITRRGVIAPEACVPPAPFIRELATRGIRIFSGDNLEDVAGPD